MSWERFVLLQFEAKVGAEVQHRMANPDSGSLCAPHSVLLSNVLSNIYPAYQKQLEIQQSNRELCTFILFLFLQFLKQ